MTERPLWAPWRIEYIKSANVGECVFCAALRARDDERCGIVERGSACFTMLNAHPYASGHLMVLPYRHVAGLEELNEPEQRELLGLATRAVLALREALEPHGFNVGLNLGEVAGAGVADHLHLHVVPRWSGDMNFMPVIAGTPVISQAIEATRAALVVALGRMTALEPPAERKPPAAER